MSWLFLILILSTLAVVCVGTAIYLRIRRHMKAAHPDHHESVNDINHRPEAGNLHS
jgi:hypothetical protein